MKLLEKILVATDFSPGARDALQMAVFVANRLHSEIILLHVVPGTSDRYSNAEGMIRTSVEEELRDSAERVRAEGIQAVETVVDFGIPFDQINRQADERDVNIIMVAARETADVGPCGLGSTAAAVRRYASKPVWIVKPGRSPAINKVLCPVDFSDASAQALRNAIHLSRSFEAELTVLTAIPLSSYHKRVGNAVAEAEEKQVLDSFLQGFDVHNVRLNKSIRRGKPLREILKACAETKSDLLVMGSVGRKRLARMLMGGVARKVAGEMPCSMITVRSEHAIRVRLDAGGSDIEAHFKQGHELLALGFPEEAARQFRHCLAKDDMYAPAWEGLAAVHERLGRHKEAKKFEAHAEHIVETLYHKEIEDDIRSQHPLFRPLFGIK